MIRCPIVLQQKNSLYEEMEKVQVDHEGVVAALQQQLEEAKQAVQGKILLV